ncbi:hypothetical protein [Methylobacterium brachiatum]|uniref:hypothetical protein n=1 Tax=Methylobacterium brachiatum TaxID=269660 RepID=UPI0008E79FFD|nr:hypothetical protein [Methylobacterium brachiatum]SFI05414.1 hypothetical protein SAMN02799642_00558 [Methylobacterium brachiatum]
MRQAIITKYHGPTNSRGARVSAKASAGRVTIPYTYDASADHIHTRAAARLALKLGWSGQFYAGGLPDGTGNVYVCLPGRPPITTIDRDWFAIAPGPDGESLPVPAESRAAFGLIV